MVLYHGTSFNNYKSIVSDEEISVTTDENSHYPKEGHAKTRRGYVYLTDLPLVALEFGSKCWLTSYGKEIQLLTVFKINISEDEIQEDSDEKEWQSSSVANGGYYRINRAIDYNKEVLEVAYFQFSDYQACCDYLDKNEPDKIIWSSKDYQKWENGDIRIMVNKDVY